MPSEPTQEGQRGCDVLYADWGSLRLLEVKQDTCVGSDGALGRFDSHAFTSATSKATLATFLRMMSRAFLSSLRRSFKFTRPLASLSTPRGFLSSPTLPRSIESHEPLISNKPLLEAKVIRSPTVSKPHGNSVPG